MITVTAGRTRGYETFEPTKQRLKPEAAFRYLAEMELGFGGQVVDCEPQTITVKTQIMDCTDTTVFEGSVEDMHHLFLVAAHYTLATSNEKIVGAAAGRVFDALNFGGQGVKPLHVKIGGGLLFGSALVVAVLQALGDFRLTTGASKPKPVVRAIDTYLLLQEYPRDEVLSTI